MNKSSVPFELSSDPPKAINSKLKVENKVFYEDYEGNNNPGKQMNILVNEILMIIFPYILFIIFGIMNYFHYYDYLH